MNEEPPVRFVADVMLGSLARWLRLLGYDTDYASQRDDAELARIARAEDRVLLTRDRELARRRGIRVLLVESQSLDEQLAQVGAAVPLRSEAGPARSPVSTSPPPRCPECNAALVPASRQQVAGEVPAYVWRHHRHFKRCPGCGRIYWRGTHWQNMQTRLGG